MVLAAIAVAQKFVDGVIIHRTGGELAVSSLPRLPDNHIGQLAELLVPLQRVQANDLLRARSESRSDEPVALQPRHARRPASRRGRRVRMLTRGLAFLRNGRSSRMAHIAFAIRGWTRALAATLRHAALAPLAISVAPNLAKGRRRRMRWWC